MESNSLAIVRFFKRIIKDGYSWFLPKEDSDGQKPELSITKAAYSLARFAEHAYDVPAKFNLESFCDTTENGGSVHYYTYETAEAAFEGVLKIHIQNAVSSNHRNYLWGYRDNDDLYVSFSIGSSMIKSETKKNQKNPSWDSTHILPIRREYLKNGFDELLHVKLFDYERGWPWQNDTQEPLGSGTFSLHELKTEGKRQSHRLKIPLGAFSSNYVTVNFTTEYFSINDAWNWRKLGVIGEQKPTRLQDGDEPPFIETVPWAKENEKVDMQPIAYFNMTSTDTQAWLWKDINPDNKVLIVSFRGTEITKMEDILANFSMSSSNLGDMVGDRYTIKPTTALQTDGIRAHEGYLNCYTSIREDILQLIHDITRWDPSWSITVTGHSLGGALSTLAAFEFANRRMNEARPDISHMTFGAMCVGNERFVQIFSDTVPNSVRVVNRQDVFPLLLQMCYHHTGGKVSIRSDDGYFVDLEEEPDVFANSQNDDDGILDNIRDAVSDFTDFVMRVLGREPFTDGLYHHLPQTYIQVVKRSVENLLHHSG